MDREGGGIGWNSLMVDRGVALLGTALSILTALTGQEQENEKFSVVVLNGFYA